MREIQLPRGQVAIVDDEDFEVLNAHQWHVYWNVLTCTFYAFRDVPVVGRKPRNIPMHRHTVGSQRGVRVEHINKNTLDNRRSNLRVCSALEHHRNGLAA